MALNVRSNGADYHYVIQPQSRAEATPVDIRRQCASASHMTRTWGTRRWPHTFEAAWNQALEQFTQAASILIVGRSVLGARLIRRMLAGEKYRIVEASRDSDLLGLLTKESMDLVILDATEMEPEVLACCSRLKADPVTEFTPILILGSSQRVNNQIVALEAGAEEFLGEPVHPEYFRTRVRSLLRHKAAMDRLEETEATLFTLAQAVEHRDRRTGEHCERLAVCSLAIGLSRGLSWSQLQAIYRGGYLHDIGKVAMPDAILFKRTRLTPQEWKVMETHTVRGEEICRPLKSLEMVLPIIRSHHEKWDGTGYPDSLRGEEIPLLARIIQLADIYDALVSARPYKPAFPPEQALRMMREETERGWRDPELMSVFFSLHESGVLRDIHESTLGAGETEPMRLSLRNIQRRLVEQ